MTSEPHGDGVSAPPSGLRWREMGPFAAQLRPRVSRLGLCLFAALWNIVLGPTHLFQPSGRAGTNDGLAVVGTITALGFLLLAVRELAMRTNILFTEGRFSVRTALAPWVRFEAPTTELLSFAIIEVEDGSFRVMARMLGGTSCTVPFALETVPIFNNWSRRRFFVSPSSYASFIAGRLNDMLAQTKGWRESTSL
jgi:hypothetical protein